MNAEQRLEAVIKQIEKVKAEGRGITEIEKMEFTAELLSVAEQRLRELGEIE